MPFAKSEKPEAANITALTFLVIWILRSIVNASTESEIDAAFVGAMLLRAGAVMISADPFFFSRRTQIVAPAVYHAVPTVYFDRAFVAAGGLISYGTVFQMRLAVEGGEPVRPCAGRTGRNVECARP
jgi:putative ABC transport system substrate-binding protein